MQDTFGMEWNPEGFVVCTLKGGPMEPRTYSDKLDAMVCLLYTSFGTYLWAPDYNGLDDYIWEFCLNKGNLPK